jgi:hypothetical protein
MQDKVVVAGEAELPEFFLQGRGGPDPFGHDGEKNVGQAFSTMTASASTSAPRGSEATPTAARAG